jgi:hypothetical protein
MTGRAERLRRAGLMGKLLILCALSVFFGCGHDGPNKIVRSPSPDEVLQGVRLDLLKDAPYYLPANENEEDRTVYLPLRKWDIIFVGSMKSGLAVGEDPVMLSKLIPGKYDHILVYVGKDGGDFAYAVELNTDKIYLDGGTPVVLGGLRFLCLGKDFGRELHSSGAHVADRNAYGVRWAGTFTPENRKKLKDADAVLTSKVREDIMSGFPYQLEFKLSPDPLIDRTIELVDDGLANGAGCADYWTSLFETYAGVCMKGGRMSADEIMDYYLNDPVGKYASVPQYLNPFGRGELRLSALLGLGFQVVEDAPHRFSCDGSEESGLVVPDRVAHSTALEDIPVREDEHLP